MADIVLIQEVGPYGPPGGSEQAAILSNGYVVRHWQWQRGSTTRGPGPYQVYFLQTDRNGGTHTGGRVNLVIVTRHDADEIRVVDNPIAGGRPALGVRFGNDWYFNVHAFSPSGNDAAGLVAAVATAVRSWNPQYNWTVGGDFNREPADLGNQPAFPQGAAILATGLPTHDSGEEYDYFVTDHHPAVDIPINRLAGRNSDHVPVMLGNLRPAAAAEPPDLKVMPIGDSLAESHSVTGGSVIGLMEPSLLSYFSSFSGIIRRSVSFVGSQGSGADGDPHYEGTPGEDISAIAKRSDTAVPQYHPNVVLVQAGTQDMKTGQTAGAAARLTAMLDKIREQNPDALVIVATLGPARDAAIQARIDSYNADIRRVVADRQRGGNGRHILLADLGALTSASLSDDGLTPNAAGKRQIANALIGVIGSAVVYGWLTEVPLRVLPFGDSITYGVGSSTSSSYRGALQSELDQSGRRYQFVGAQTSGTMAQPANEGHPGWQIGQLAAIEHCTVQSLLPNVVLLHIGTNDINANLDLGAAPDRLMNLIEAIRADDPGVTVLVGSMLGTTWSETIAADMTAFNTRAGDRVNLLRSGGAHVAWVDMSEVTTANMQDGLHPNDVGYTKMADAWNAAIEQAAADDWLSAAKPPTSGAGCVADPPDIGSGPIPWTELGLIAGGVSDSNLPAPPSTGPADGRPVGAGADEKIQFADLNSDGRADYIAVNADSSATAYLNGGVAGGGPIPWTELGLIAGGVNGGLPKGATIQFADLNADGRADYLVIHPDSSVTAYLNGGVPTTPGSAPIPWTELGVIATGVQGGLPAGARVQFADLNGDGRADYLVVLANNQIRAYLNGATPGSAAITWTELGVIGPFRDDNPVTGEKVLTHDLNGDGLADIIYLRPDSSATAYITKYVRPEDTNLPVDFTAQGLIAGGVNGGAPAAQIRFADLNGDGRADYVYVHSDSSATAYLNGGVPAGAAPVPWTELGLIAGGISYEKIQFADLNGDGRADYVVVHPDSSVTAYLNGGVPSPPGSAAIPWTPLGLIAGGVDGGIPAGGKILFADLNGDGRADYVVVHPDSSVTGYLNGGVPSSPGSGPIPWTPLGQVASGVQGGIPRGGAIDFADLNGDRRADYIVVRSDSSADGYLNGGVPSPAGSAAIPWTGQGLIAGGVQGGAPGQSIHFADLNGDRRADYIYVHDGSSATAYRNGGVPAQPGPIPWTELGLIAGGVQGGAPAQQIHFADLDNDGKADYINIRPDTSVIGYRNGGPS
ncbi:FG-GAP-like repeat-containing protein [Amycolatopsis sp. NBRC 101858]|uniref:FG-GAP-like repeat-containing protein n=1 Tax=Amycolatopsis sp. NBRC 101858 TaxID=3032200 RepID=UPI002552FB54|nr:FG-GAP-like repeat-containing protein [Amycolatopsis sp. NBRC 101858]